MREANPVAVELEDASSERELDVVDDRASQRLENGHGGRSECRDGNERLAYATGQRAQALRDDGAQAFGQRDVNIVGADRAVGQSPSQLEREERVPAGCPMHADDNGSRQCEPELAPQKPVDCADGERPD